jgi:hypothetical protein
MQNPPSLPVSANSLRAPRFPAERVEHVLRWALGAAMLMRVLFPFYDSPLNHLFSDPGRHWENGLYFLHPNVMGSGDPYLYQLWTWLLQQAAVRDQQVILTGVGFLCAMVPYGWYRAFKELMPRSWALGGALVMALVPGFIGIYAYFMNETLLLALTGFAFWATFRAYRKRTVRAFAAACALWLACGFTRSVALPMALLCLLSIWLPQPRKLAKAAVGVVLLAALLIPAGLHGRYALHFFAPFGNLYLNEIYSRSGHKNIGIDFGPQGRYGFGSPSFYNPSFYPLSDWLSAREGTFNFTIDLSQGRRDWVAERARAEAERTFPRWRELWENLLYLSFAEAWPDNDLRSVTGFLTVWTRWVWPPLILVVAWGAWRGRFSGREWLLPVCGLGMFLYLALQRESVMEGRFRKPLDPIYVASAVVMVYRRPRRALPAAVLDRPAVPAPAPDLA